MHSTAGHSQWTSASCFYDDNWPISAISATSLEPLETRWPTAKRYICGLRLSVDLVTDHQTKESAFQWISKSGALAPMLVYLESTFAADVDTSSALREARQSFRKKIALPNGNFASHLVGGTDTYTGLAFHKEADPAVTQLDSYRGFWRAIERRTQAHVPGFRWQGPRAPGVLENLIEQISGYPITLDETADGFGPNTLWKGRYELLTEGLTYAGLWGDKASDLAKEWADIADQLMGLDSPEREKRELELHNRFRQGLDVRVEHGMDAALRLHESHRPIDLPRSLAQTIGAIPSGGSLIT